MTGTGPTAYDVVDHYDDAYFRDLAQRYSTRNRFARRRIQNVFSLLPPLEGQRVIDLGCGMGTFTLEAAKKGARAVGLDFAPAALRVARSVAAQEGQADARFVQGDAARLPFASGCADIVVAADVTEHLDDDTLRRVLDEVRRVLRPGGSFILYTPSPTHLFEQLRMRGILLPPEPSHIGMRTADALRAAIEACGLVTRRVDYLPSHLPLFSLLERALGRWIPLLRRRIGIVASKPGVP